MKVQNKNHILISTVLAFALIPLSGFATDVYLPSFPSMATIFGTTQGDIQLSLAVFVISNGIGQLFVGWLLDWFRSLSTEYNFTCNLCPLMCGNSFHTINPGIVNHESDSRNHRSIDRCQ